MVNELIKSTTFVLVGVALGLGLVVASAKKTPAKKTAAPMVVICESGSFDFDNGSAEDQADFYFVESATCTLKDANGRPVLVKVID